jgi:hypothetical protein
VLCYRPSPNPPGAWPGLGLEPASPVASGPGLAVGAFADNTYVLNGRVDELALYKRLLTAGERAWLSRNNGQGRAYADIPAPQLPPGVSLAYTYDDPAHAHAVTAAPPRRAQGNAAGLAQHD